MALRCRVCAARGVDGPALPGVDVCAAHQHFAGEAAAAPAAAADDSGMDDDSGLTQAAAAFQLSGVPARQALLRLQLLVRRARRRRSQGGIRE